MQFCLGVLNNVLHVFFPEACFLSEILSMQKNIFPRASSRDLLLNEKQDTFVSLKDEVAIIH